MRSPRSAAGSNSQQQYVPAAGRYGARATPRGAASTSGNTGRWSDGALTGEKARRTQSSWTHLPGVSELLGSTTREQLSSLVVLAVFVTLVVITLSLWFQFQSRRAQKKAKERAHTRAVRGWVQSMLVIDAHCMYEPPVRARRAYLF